MKTNKQRITAMVLCLIAALSFCSCQHSDSKMKIIGEWENVYERQESQGGDVTEKELHNTINFKADGTFTDKYSTGVVREGTWTVDGRFFTISYEKCYENSKPISSIAWKQTGRVEKVTDSKMMIKTRMTYPGYDGYLDIENKYVRK